jgi:hypothetical protein
MSGLFWGSDVRSLGLRVRFRTALATKDIVNKPKVDVGSGIGFAWVTTLIQSPGVVVFIDTVNTLEPTPE